MTKHCDHTATHSELQTMLSTVQQQKQTCKQMIISICRTMWVLIVNACGYQFTLHNQRHTVQHHKHIKLAIQEIDNETERYAFCFFYLILFAPRCTLTFLI